MRLIDNSCIHLGGIDRKLISVFLFLIFHLIIHVLALPPRDRILYLTFPKEWKTDNIFQLFSSFGKLYLIIREFVLK